MSGLLLAASVAALVLVTGLVGAVRVASRRRAAFAQAGGTTAHDVDIVGLPEASGCVRVRVGTTTVVVEDPESHRWFDFTATGLTLDKRIGDWSRGGERERTATGRDGRGNHLEIVGDHRDMVSLWNALQDRPLPAEPRAPVSPPARDTLVGMLFVAAAGLGVLFVLAVLSRAVPVDGLVVDPASGDEYCLVEWNSPWDGDTHRNGVDCYQDTGGSVRLWALDVPFRGQVWDTDTPLGLSAVAAGVVVLGLLVAASGRWSQRRRARRAAAQTSEAVQAVRKAQQDENRPVPPLGLELPAAEHLTYATARPLMAAVARAREQRTWSAQERDEHRQVLRLIARIELLGRALRVAPVIVVPGFALILGSVLAWTSVDGLLAGREPSATAEATVGDVVEGSRFLVWPEDVELTFTTGSGEEVETVVAVLDRDALASTALVEYSVDKPFRARVVGDAGPERGVTVSAVTVLLAVIGSAVVSLTGPVRRRRTLARADRSDPVRLAYVLDRAAGPPDERADRATGAVLLFDQSGAPAFQLHVTGAGVARAVASGTALVRGELREGALVQCELGDADARFVGELLYLDPQEWLDDLRDEFHGAPVT